MSLPPTPSQTVGPFFAPSLLKENLSELVGPDHPDAIRIIGTVYDGAGEVVPDAMIEVWQANGHGRYAHPEDDRENLPLDEDFEGFGRFGSDPDGTLVVRDLRICEENPELFLDEGKQFTFVAHPVGPRQLRDKVGQRALEHGLERT